MCVRCQPFGRDIANLIQEQCFSLKLRHYNFLHKKYSSQNNQMCFDPQGFKIGEKRHVHGPNDIDIPIVINKKTAAAKIYRKEKDGTLIYEIKLEAELLGCPRCGVSIPLTVTYNPNSCYHDYSLVECNNCNYQLYIRHSLDVFNPCN